MLSSENPPTDPSCLCEISQLNNNSNSTDDQQPSGDLQSDLLISCPKFTIRDYAFSNRRKDIKTNWPFSEKSLQLCLNHGVKTLLPPFQSLDAEDNPGAHLSTTETSLVSKENEYHLIGQASRPTDHNLSFTSDVARLSKTSVHTSLNKSEGVRILSSMVVEAETSLNYSASKPAKKLARVSSKADNLMKPLIKKCREIVKLNNFAADQNKLENNTSKSETMASKVCPVCKTFTSSSNTTLNAHIDQCLSGESIGHWASDPKVTKSRIKPRRMRSMVEIYEKAQHCTIEELERRNGTNLAACLTLPAQDMEAGPMEKKRKSPVDFEETENEGAVYVDANGTKLRVLSKFNDLSSGTGTRRHVDGCSNKISLVKKKKKKLQEKHHKLQIRLSDRKELCSPRHHQNSQINFIQKRTSGPEEDLEIEEAFAKPQSTPVLVKYREPEPVARRAFSKRSVLPKMNDKGDHLHPTWTKKMKLAGVNNVESHRYSYVNGGCGSKSRKSSGTPPASPRSSEPHDGYGRVHSLRRSVRVPSGPEPFHDGNNPVGERNQKESRGSDSSVKYKNKDDLRNKLNPMASLSMKKVKMKSALTRNANSVGYNSKHLPNGHDLSSTSRGFLSFSKKQASRLSKPQSPASESTCPKNKRMDFKRPHAYSESGSDGEEVERQTVAKTSDNVTLDRRAFKVGRDIGKIKVSGKGKILVIKGMKSASKHCERQHHGTNDSYSDNITANSYDENESAQNNVQPCEKDVVDEATCSNPLFEASKGLYKSSDVPSQEVAGHLDVQSDSSGYVKFIDGPSSATEDARYPLESFFNGGEKLFYIDEDGKSILDQNVHATTELHCNDVSGSYYTEVDLIPIPGPPGSFLPSPSSDEFHGNSTPTYSHDRSSENHHEFADRDSSDSPSPTSTISNSDIAKFDSSLNEKLHFRHSSQDVMRPSASDATGGTTDNKIPLDPSAAFAAGEGLDPVEPKVHLLYSEMEAPLGSKNDQQCRCSRKDGAVLSSVVSNYKESSLLSWPTMPSVSESLVNTEVKSDKTGRAKNCNLSLNMPSSGHLAGEFHNAIRYQPRLIPNNESTDSGIKFFFNNDGESASPSTSNPVFRLMGKDLMVVNKDETFYSHQTSKEVTISESSVDLAPDTAHGMGLMNLRRRPSIKPALMASDVNPGNSNSRYGYQPETSHSASAPLARAADFQVPYMMGVNSLPIKWNCVAQGSNLIPNGSFPSSSSAAHHMRSTTSQYDGFS